MYSDPTGHKNYKPGESTAEYYSNQAKSQAKSQAKKQSITNSTKSTNNANQIGSTQTTAPKKQTTSISVPAKGSSVMDSYSYITSNRTSREQEYVITKAATAKWQTSQDLSASDVLSASKSQENFLDSAVNYVKSYSNSYQDAMTGYAVAVAKDLVVSPIMFNASLLYSVITPGATPGDKILNSFGQFNNNMQQIDDIEQSIIYNTVTDEKAYYYGKIGGDISSFPVAAAEMVGGSTTAAAGGLVDVVSGLLSETGVGALVFAGSIGVTAIGAAEAEFGLTTGIGTGVYFAKDLQGLQSSGFDPEKWNQGSFDSSEESLEYHYQKHGDQVGANSEEEYLKKAEEFAKTAKKGSTKKEIYGAVEGVIRYFKNGKYIDIAPDGTIISYGRQ